MNLKDKLKGFPTVYYCNLDVRTDKRKYMESQFDFWEINYERVSSSKYTPKNYKDWENAVIVNPECNLFEDYFPYDYGEDVRYPRHLLDVCINYTRLETIKKWFETTNDQYMILMEDDTDLDMIEYWHFDWEYLMDHIPYDWDCIQLEGVNNLGVPCFLHPVLDRNLTGPLMINRDYASKLIRIHFTKDGKLNLDQKISSYKWTEITKNKNLSVDYVISKNGRTYCMPLTYLNPQFGSYDINLKRKDLHEFYENVKQLHHKWWKELRDDYTLKEFFTYGKPNDLVLKVDSEFYLVV